MLIWERHYWGGPPMSLHEHSSPSHKQFEHVEVAANLKQKYKKLITHPKIQSQAVSINVCLEGDILFRKLSQHNDYWKCVHLCKDH